MSKNSLWTSLNDLNNSDVNIPDLDTNSLFESFQKTSIVIYLLSDFLFILGY